MVMSRHVDQFRIFKSLGNTERNSNEIYEVVTFIMLFSGYILGLSIRKSRKKEGMEKREKETERTLLAIVVLVENRQEGRPPVIGKSVEIDVRK
jgi:hypothetical protein